jgi:predicted RecB family endonuclease
VSSLRGSLHFVVEINGKKLPIEVKVGSVNRDAINNMVYAMQGLAYMRGIIVTSSQVPDEIRRMANINNIHLVEGATSEEDLRRGLADAKLKTYP